MNREPSLKGRKSAKSNSRLSPLQRDRLETATVRTEAGVDVFDGRHEKARRQTRRRSKRFKNTEGAMMRWDNARKARREMQRASRIVNR